jgi:hypothetical protein
MSSSSNNIQYMLQPLIFKIILYSMIRIAYEEENNSSKQGSTF